MEFHIPPSQIPHSTYGAVLHINEPLHKQSARGASFQITLASNRHIFVGKGTVEVFLSDLLHEGQAYKLLRRVQGSATPIVLVNIDLKGMYYLDTGVKVIHMLPIS